MQLCRSLASYGSDGSDAKSRAVDVDMVCDALCEWDCGNRLRHGGAPAISQRNATNGAAGYGGRIAPNAYGISVGNDHAKLHDRLYACFAPFFRLPDGGVDPNAYASEVPDDPRAIRRHSA